MHYVAKVKISNPDIEFNTVVQSQLQVIWGDGRLSDAFHLFMLNFNKINSKRYQHLPSMVDNRTLVDRDCVKSGNWVDKIYGDTS